MKPCWLLISFYFLNKEIEQSLFFAVTLLLVSLGCTNTKDKDNEIDAFLDECEEMTIMVG